MRKGKGWKRLLSVILAASVINSTLSSSIVMATENPQQDDSVVFYSGENGGADAGIDLQTEDQSGESEGMAGGKTEGQDGGSGKEESAGENESSGISGQGDVSSADPQESAGASGNTGAENNNESIPTEGNGDQRDNTEDLSSLYENGQVKIYNLSQLKKVGTGEQIHSGDVSEDTFGTGDALADENGNALTYGNDTQYMLMNDIPMSGDDVWTLPEGFRGSFAGQGGTADSPLYDAATDTIYVYNNYQLATIKDPEALKTVMSNDMIAEEFGVGQVVFADAEGAVQLEYTADHNYVISADFTGEMPELTAAEVQADVTDQQGGRDFVGQVYQEIDGKTYILIGNEYQLREIGKGTQVTPMLYVKTKIGIEWGSINLSQILYTPYYPGDADLNLTKGLDSDGNEQNFSYLEDDNRKQDLFRIDYDEDGLVGNLLGPIGSALSAILRPILGILEWIPGLDDIIASLVGTDNSDIVIVDKELRTSEDDQGFISVADGLHNQKYKDLKYTSDANYIVFRDINLSASLEGDIGSDNGAGTGNGVADDWTPIMLSGDMLGQKNMDPTNAPVTISNINVATGETLEAANHIGVGFFGTISGRNDASDIGTSSEQTIVKDINLSDVTVTNNATKLNVNQSLIEGLLGQVGGLLGGLIDGITDILGEALGIPGLEGLSLGGIVTELLTLKGKEPDTYATGSFAGRVTGNVRIENCKVTEAAVSNVTNMTGGFVGYSEGREEYKSGLDGLLGKTVKLLSKVLNIIPGIGLGDLIELLLQKDIPLGQLIPTGYKKPQFENCQVTLKENSGAIGTNTSDYNGGFVGVQVGTEMNLCTVTGLTKVEAKNYAGGFAGLERDDTLQGATDNLGISLFPDIRSKQTNCKVESTSLVVEAAESYAGGFNGCMANSISENGQITDLDRVTAGQNYSGGYTGRATIGYSIALDNDNISGTLLGSVGEVVNKVGTGGLNSHILQLVGVQGAEIKNFNIGGSAIIIEAKQNYAGGLVGSGDGTIIENSSADSSPKLNLQSVSAGSEGVEGKYAGGVAGALTTANGAGLLNEVVGLVDVQEYKASNINVDVQSVTATGDYAGGAFGLLTGGEVDQVSVGAIETVTANNYAGGFVGRSGVGSLVDAKGLDILGLGTVKVGNLVSIGNLTSVDIKNSTVTGKNLTVSATGNREGNDYFAGGFVSENNSGKISNSSVTGLQRVFTATTGFFWGDKDTLAASYAGGFAARSQVGGLANVGADGDTVEGLLGKNGVLEINDLINAVGYLIPSYTNCFVKFTDRNFDAAQVSAAVAGGFIGEMQGGTIDNRGLNAENKGYAVRNAEYITGTYYAGGFAGKILSGGLAQSDGLSLLGKHIDVSGLLNLIPTYIPKVYSAGVQSSADGLKVYASESDSKDVDSGSAGGYAGLTSGARISNSIVKDLATKSKATDAAPKESDYAVKAPRFAGGYVGKAEIGSAAAVGQSLDLFETITIGNLTEAIAAVESKFEGCDVYGKAGGFNVNSTEGSAGGYAGVVEGSNFNDSDSYNFEYIEGVTSAGGYAGTIQPGDVASLAESTEILKGLLEVENLLQVAQTFIARIWNSETTAVPCGGYVIATGTSDGANLQGLAGGYAGYNLGGQIKGEYACNPIFKDNSFTPKTAAAIRIRSVEGKKFAGGFTGLMEAANVAETGNLKLLWGLVNANNLLQAVSAVYPTEENTKVTGPLDSMSLEVWDSWVNAVGSSGAYGDIFTEHRTFETEEALNEFLADYVYGYTVKANAKDNTMTGVDAGGSAGGYVGRMEGGVITNGHAQDLRSVEAYRSAGGFAGEMVTGTIADLGNLSVGDLDVADGVGIVKTFVPVIYTSRVDGYSSGFTVEATAAATAAAVDNTSIGNAGGFVGYADGAQIFDNKDGKNEAADPNAKAKAAAVTNLRTVTGHKNVGGFAGIMQAGAALGADVTSSSGLLNQILSHLISQEQVSNLVNVLQATRTVVDSAEVTGYMPANEGDNAKPVFSVVGNKGEKADFAGGFAGKLTGALIGDESSETKNSVVITGLKSVAGGKHVGGFFGLADVDGLVEVAGDSETSILGLIGLGNVDVLNAFRTYIYSATVNGAENSGLSIYAKERTGSEISRVIDKVVSFFTGDEAVDQTDKDGNAGGFGGSLKDSSVVNCEVNNLNRVNALTYAGGFIGFTGKSGVVDADKVGVLQDLLKVSAGVADIFGSQVKDSNVNGSDKTGYIIRSKDGEECIAGGFIGYGDLARVDNCRAKALKQVYSDQIAGGFIGKTSFAYLAKVNAGSNALLNPILSVVNQLLKHLYLDDLQNIGLIQVTLPEPFNKVLNLEVLNDNNVLSVTLLGLRISVGLVRGDETTSDVAQIHIGDSYIEVECHNDPEGNYISNDANISIGLIKANRTRVGDSSVSGISIGYDVFGGGAGNDKDGSGEGYAGGFAGYNDEGLLEDNSMYQADTIKGAPGQIGEFSGTTSLQSNYTTLKDIEGDNNHYFVYRLWDEDGLTDLYAKDGTTKITDDAFLMEDWSEDSPYMIDQTAYYMYPVLHMQHSENYTHEDLWNGAYQTTEKNIVRFPVNVYVSDAQADLMLGTPTTDNVSDPDKSEGDMQDPCDDEATLTIQKIWYDDNDRDTKRPEKISITVTRKGDEWEKEIQMSSENVTTDPNVWTETVKVPVNKETGDGTYEKYDYEVNEASLVAEGYITIYGESADGYTLYIYNYRTEEFTQKDTVVIDYGLPVDVDVLTNDKMEQSELEADDYELAGVGVLNDTETGNGYLLNSVTEGMEGDLAGRGNSSKGSFGTAEVITGSADTGSDQEMIGKQLIRYTPNTMQMNSQMNSYEKLLYAVELKDHVKNNQKYVYGEVNVIPATTIYYEDNFETVKQNGENVTEGIKYTNGKNKEGTENAVWTTEAVQSDSNPAKVQDTDRPGMEAVANAWTDSYGNDSHYTDDLKFSNGSSHVVTVDESNLPYYGGTCPTAEFTFTGTGFDVISVTSGDTGVVQIDVKKHDSDEIPKSYTADTYYGYTYKDGQWFVDPLADGSNALYQIPILKISDLTYGTYDVVITPMYINEFDHHYSEKESASNDYKVYLDAIRIYNPAGTSTEHSDGSKFNVIDQAYAQDGEQNPQYMEIRDFLLNAGEITETPVSDGIGTVFIDGNSELKDIKEYESVGPKNEVYLANKQAISFYLWADAIPDKVHISAKLAKGNLANLVIALAVNEGTGDNAADWNYYKIDENAVGSSYDLYYDFFDQCIWEDQYPNGEVPDGQKRYKTKYPIVIANYPPENTAETESGEMGSGESAYDGILSLTNLKWTGNGVTLSSTSEEKSDQNRRESTPIQISMTANHANVRAAYYFLNSPISEEPGEIPGGDDSQPGDIPGTTPGGDDSQPGDI
ncbi:Cna B-type domain-containing protein, partial [Mediterraneibacter glycyrrhizinilyticus]